MASEDLPEVQVKRGAQEGHPTDLRKGPQVRDYGFNWSFVRRFAGLNRHLFPGSVWTCRSAWYLGCLVVINACEQVLAYYIGFISGSFTESLVGKYLDDFLYETGRAALLITAMTLVKSCRQFNTSILTVEWRRNLTRALHSRYFRDRLFYDLNALGGGGASSSSSDTVVDNVDQRIAMDAELFCTTYGLMINDLIVTPVAIMYYAYSAYSRTGWVGPTAMFLIFLVSAVLNKFLMTPVVRKTVEREMWEGEFRFGHAFVRLNSESLAFVGGEAVSREAEQAHLQMLELCRVQQGVFNRQFFLDLATNFFDYLGSIASYVAIAVPIFAGVYDTLSPPELSAVVSNNAFVCMYLIYQLSKLVDMAGNVSKVAGVTHRVAEVFDRSRAKVDLQSSSSSSEVMDDDDDGEETSMVVLVVGHLDVRTPDGKRVLVSDLDLKVRKGDRYLITGPSSSGKTSLLRILRGLWPHSGRMRWSPLPESTMFLPQKPFISNHGSLRQLITYPSNPTFSVTETVMVLNLLRRFGLAKLLDRIGECQLDGPPARTTVLWTQELSPGEMQIVSFLRVFYHQPEVVLLDEATSALSPEVEAMLYSECMTRGLTILSVGHRTSLMEFHSYRLHLGLPDGAWKLETISST